MARLNPFSSALNMAPFCSEITAQYLKNNGRADAEYFRSDLLWLDRVFVEYPELDRLCTITHPAEIPRVYEKDDTGVPFILAQNIRPLIPESIGSFKISTKTSECIPQNSLRYGDVLVTRTGANHGTACAYLGKSGACYTSGEGLIVRGEQVKAGYLAAWLSNKWGAELCKRAAYGSGQPHIAPSYLRRTRIPRLGKLEERVHDLVLEAWRIIEETGNYYWETEAEMLERLEWSKVRMDHDLGFEMRAQRLREAGRTDAEHFQPKYRRLLSHLQKKGARRLGDFCPIPNRGGQPKYEEGGPVLVINSKHLGPTGLEVGGAERTTKEFYEAGKNASGRLKQYDVLLYSTGAYIGRTNCFFETIPALASNHVTVIRSDAAICNPVYLALFLNSKPGIMQSEQFASGSAQREIYPSNIAEFRIFIPTNDYREPDLKWQGRLAEKVIAAAQAKDQARRKLKEAKDLVEQEVEKVLQTHSRENNRSG